MRRRLGDVSRPSVEDQRGQAEARGNPVVGGQHAEAGYLSANHRQHMAIGLTKPENVHVKHPATTSSPGEYTVAPKPSGSAVGISVTLEWRARPELNWRPP